ncbi:MAG: hypothetical protein ACYTAO_05450 [Planctomycetota bacterium]
MLFQPARTLRLFGWDYQSTMFFPAQSGVFLILSAGAYLTAIWYRGFVWFIVVAKTAAVVFLVSEHFLLGPAAPRTVLVAAALDGLMGASVAAIIIWRARTSKLPSSKLDGF